MASGAPRSPTSLGRPLLGAPMRGLPWLPSPSRRLSKKYPSSTFYYSWHHFFASEKPVKFSVCLEHFQHPTKSFWTCSETFPDHWFSSAKSNLSIFGSSEKFPAAPKNFRKSFLQKNSRSYQNNSGTLQKYQVLTGTFSAQWFTPKQLFGFTETIPVFSLRNFSVFSETFSVTFSQTPCLEFSR